VPLECPVRWCVCCKLACPARLTAPLQLLLPWRRCHCCAAVELVSAAPAASPASIAGAASGALSAAGSTGQAGEAKEGGGGHVPCVMTSCVHAARWVAGARGRTGAAIIAALADALPAVLQCRAAHGWQTCIGTHHCKGQLAAPCRQQQQQQARKEGGPVVLVVMLGRMCAGRGHVQRHHSPLQLLLPPADALPAALQWRGS
jgi:hypothetical protein